MYQCIDGLKSVVDGSIHLEILPQGWTAYINISMHYTMIYTFFSTVFGRNDIYKSIKKQQYMIYVIHFGMTKAVGPRPPLFVGVLVLLQDRAAEIQVGSK